MLALCSRRAGEGSRRQERPVDFLTLIIGCIRPRGFIKIIIGRGVAVAS